MFATRALRQAAAAAAHAERTPMIKFLGKRSLPSASIDHTPHAHPASPSQKLPEDFTSKATSFSSYRQQAQQHGPLGRSTKSADGSIGSLSGQSLGSVAPPKGEYFDRNELPPRFRRSPIDLTEIDAIETGGATLVC
ncbi:Oxoglutarate dehydrogenase (succinyl-transferring) [Chlorociboria aeruginascens]|nr:Oxoglutarate dehydrogenase (succinyl-transferring) [Chlorociboria aeruginascens]